jgi:hypothetical protein
MKPLALNKLGLLSKLPKTKPSETSVQDADQFGNISLARSLGLLAELDHEHEYKLCRAVAERFLGQVPEPDRIDEQE